MSDASVLLIWMSFVAIWLGLGIGCVIDWVWLDFVQPYFARRRHRAWVRAGRPGMSIPFENVEQQRARSLAERPPS